MRISSLKKMIQASGLVLGLGLSGIAQSTTLAPLSTEQLVDASDYIVRGTVTQVWTTRDSDGRIWTRAQFEVERTFKGQPDAGLVIDQAGGSLSGVTTRVGGAARFSPGEEAVLFLEELDSGHLVTVGMFQGKYTVQLDPHTRDFVVH
ncbi:MAG: hypothetical protein QGG40_00175, partial [Myxococcota bacterium]|nr:hypothetical protein [Myxococcota bacterium]